MAKRRITEGFVSGVGNGIRQFFARSDMAKAAQIQRGGSPSVERAGLPFNLVSQFGYDSLAEHLRIDQDLQARYTDYEEMDEYPEISCISSKTLVFLPGKTAGLQGNTVAIAKLCEAAPGGDEPLYVMAFDHRLGRVVVAKAKWPRMTGQKVDVVRVKYVDADGSAGSVCTTPDHLFMLRDGSYRAAKDLSANDALMPLKSRVGGQGYPEIYQPMHGEAGVHTARGWEALHRIAAQGARSRPLSWKAVVHHKNGDKTDCYPTNLQVMNGGQAAHAAEHAALRSDAKRRKAIRQTVAGKWKDPNFKLRVAKAHQGSPKWLQREADGEHKHREATGTMSDAHRQAISDGRTIDLSPSVVEAAVRSSASFNDAARKVGVSWNTLMRRMVQFDFDRSMLGSLLGGPVEGQASYANHRVVSVEPAGAEDVYDIEVPGYHNFAVGDENGEGMVFVHNSAYDIYADDSSMPNMENGQSVWVTSDNKAVEEDLQDMLHKRVLIEDDIWGLERTIAKYGNCVRRGGRVWGVGGSKEIELVEAGERILGWRDGDQAVFQVAKRYENGQKRILRIRTKHREVFVTEEHPMLVRRGSGCEWVAAKDLRMKRWPSGGIDVGRTDKLVICTRMAPGEVPTWAELFDGKDPLETPWGNKESPNEIALPERITPWMVRLIGFLLGDGYYVGTVEQTGQVSYARGVYEDLNDHYDGLLKRLGLQVAVDDDGTCSTVTSVKLKRLLTALGWKQGSKNKRVPSWVYGLPEEYREEFLWGFIDADGWSTEPKTCLGSAFHYEIANYDLARDLKTLIDGLGYRSGNLRQRDREPGFEIAGKVVKTVATAWTLTFMRIKFDATFVAENVVAIEVHGDDDVFDVEVSDEAHNFVVDGVVVHNSFGELLVDKNGLIGINFLPPPTVRRVEGPQGQLLGFIQDIRGEFNVSLQDFYKLAAERGAEGERRRPPGELTIFEDWEMVHWRLRGKHLRSVYGHCLAGDSRVWTPDGPIEIRQIKPGQRVFTRHAGMLRTTVVLDQVCNGVKRLFKIKTKHREIRVTTEHPMLVDRGGKNNAWVPAEELKVGMSLVAVANAPDIGGGTPLGIRLLEVTDATPVALTERGAAALREVGRTGKHGPSQIGLRTAARSLGISSDTVYHTLDGRTRLSLGDMQKLFAAVRLPFFEGAVELPSDERLKLPDFVEPWFARFWGFMTGDGWITDQQVVFALGVNDDQNMFYEQLLQRMGLSTSRTQTDGRDSQVYASSVTLVKLMREMGWIGGAHEKRIPGWVFSLSRECREAFVLGYTDADGWTTENGRYHHVECCNRELLRDAKALIDGLGWVSGNVRHRERGERTFPNGITSGPSDSYLLYFRKDILSDGDFASEEILSIDADVEEDVYDICVADAGHSFIADGLMVHNSVADSARWIWRRLSLLEDALLIYKLSRAPARYAFYVDIGEYDHERGLAYVNRVKNQFVKKKFVNPCLTGDTLISCLDGKSRSMRELAEAGRDTWVYSFDLSRGEVVPGHARNPRKTGDKVPVYRVVLDNGAVVRATGHHPFLMRDGIYRRADQLKPGDRLMPLRLNKSSGGESYVRVKQPSDERLDFVHVLIARELWPDRYAELGSPAVHHVDRCKRNNDPSNLELMERSDHAIEHLTENLGRARAEYVRKVQSDPELAAKVAGRLSAWRSRDPERVKAFMSEHGMKNMAARKEVAAPTYEIMEEMMRVCIERDPLITAEDMMRELNANESFLAAYQGLPTTVRQTMSVGCLRMWFKNRGRGGFKQFKREIVGHCRWRNGKYEKRVGEGSNHRVVDVAFDGYEDVYNMDVEKYANFAVVSGVFVHNSTGKMDMRHNPLCLAGDTSVMMFDGGVRTIAEMVAAFGRGEEQVVLSSDLGDGSETCGTVTWAGKTRRRAELVKVVLGNGNSVRVTPDHKMIRFSREEVEAQTLVPGDLLMSAGAEGGVAVVTVDRLVDREDTYTITVEPHHTFAVAAGVMVMNSHDEDFFIPSKGGKDSTRIELLQGPDYAETDTVEYHRDKLVSAIKIPKAYLGYGGEASKSSLANEDIRFARTVMRIQRETRSGLRKACRVHLVAKGADVDRHEYNVVMSVPSAILELAKLEVMSATADLAARTGEILSSKWVLTSLFKFSEEEAESLMAEKDEDDLRKGKVAAEVQRLMMMAQTPPAPQGVSGEGEAPSPEGGGEVATPAPESVRARSEMLMMERRLTKLMERQSVDIRRDLDRKVASKWAVEDKTAAALKSQPDLARRLRNLEGLLGEVRSAMRPIR